MRLYTYFRSSAAYRVRIALDLKQLDYDAVPVHLVRDGGQQHAPGYRALNPLGNVPTLETEAGALTQSLAIIEYLDEIHPQPPLLPTDAWGRARVRALALSIACDVHPLNNLRVTNYLRTEVGAGETAIAAWYRHWIGTGLAGVERLLADSPLTGTYCHGETPGLADCCLVPQVFNARRFDCDLTAMPTVVRIDEACRKLEAFERAAPSRQPEAE